MAIILMLLLISLLIVIHELGHFLSAKMFGVRVTRFAIGLPLGPVLFRKKFGDTEFLIHAFLFGGYVAFLDDHEEEELIEDGDITQVVVKKEKVPLDSPLRFSNKKPWQQAIVFVAGVFSNFVFALLIILMTALYTKQLPTGTYKIFINDIVKENNGSNIIQKGLKSGDLIYKVNDKEVKTPYNFVFMVQKSKYHDGLASSITISKNLGELLLLNKGRYKYIPKGTIVKLPKTMPEKELNVNNTVYDGYERYKPDETSISESAKNLRNDVQNKKTYKVKEDNKITYEMLAQALSDTYKPIKITVIRDGKEIVFNDIKTDKDGVLGIKFKTEEIFMPTKGFLSAASNTWDYAWRNTKIMTFGLWQILTGKIPMSDLHGIVVITKIGGDVIEQDGVFNGFLLTALISIDLAIINLLPIPALDGGHLMILAIERLFGRKLNEEAVKNISNICFFILLAIMLVILLNDIFALVNNKF